MPVSIKLKYPQELIYKPLVRQRLYDIALFVRDLWLARSPQRTGAYMKGLLKSNSIRIGSGEIVITNFAPHAQYYEEGHKAFNIAERMLANGKNVKVSKEGYKYKYVKIPRGLESRARADSLQKTIFKAFGAIIPKGVMKAVYKVRQSLKKPLKMKMKKGAGDGVFVISEKTLRQRPGAWRIPPMAPHYLAKDIQREVMPILNEAVQKAIQEQAKKEVPKKELPKFKGVVVTPPKVQRRAK